jgi:hypothetical protein
VRCRWEKVVYREPDMARLVTYRRGRLAAVFADGSGYVWAAVVEDGRDCLSYVPASDLVMER